MERSASGYASLLVALEEALEPPRIVVARGTQDALAEFATHARETFRPDALTLSISQDVTRLPPSLAKPAASAGFDAWICRGVTCLPPVHDLEAVDRLLDSSDAFG
jgi:uncharacterized protein YyaL (SSP411 family)